MALIRYPGSKEKLAEEILSRFPDQLKFELWSNALHWEYREPFFGAGAIGFRVLKRLDPRCRVWLNDVDYGIVSLWEMVRGNPKALTKRITLFEPSSEYFYRFKDEDGRDLPLEQAGFRKLAVHRMSYSGLGVMSGGPLGGRDQENARYDVACRWNPEKMKRDIVKLHRIMQPFANFQFTQLDFAELIHDAPRECFIYADPPYYVKGQALYKYAMMKEDHERLASLLRETRAAWVLSYDDHAYIRYLYRWAHIEELQHKYTMARTKGKRPKNREILITPIVA